MTCGNIFVPVCWPRSLGHRKHVNDGTHHNFQSTTIQWTPAEMLGSDNFCSNSASKTFPIGLRFRVFWDYPPISRTRFRFQSWDFTSIELHSEPEMILSLKIRDPGASWLLWSHVWRICKICIKFWILRLSTIILLKYILVKVLLHHRFREEAAWRRRRALVGIYPVVVA